MSQNLIIVVALGFVAILSIVTLFLSGALTSDDGGAAKKTEELMAMLEQAGVDPKSSHVRVKPFNVAII